MSTTQQGKYARQKEVAKHFGVCKTILWCRSKGTDFPQPSQLGKKITLFNIAEVDHQWIETHEEAK